MNIVDAGVDSSSTPALKWKVFQCPLEAHASVLTNQRLNICCYVCLWQIKSTVESTKNDGVKDNAWEV